jgi:hypothetical protein
VNLPKKSIIPANFSISLEEAPMKNRLIIVILVLFILGITVACNPTGPGSDVPAGVYFSPKEPTPPGNIPGIPTNSLPGGPLKPVHFDNLGSVAVTISPWTYTPPGGIPVSTGPNPSTVAFPGGNPSSYLSLPFGTYTWCYSWELGDINNDSMIEYAHALDERPVTLDESSSDELEFAVQVSLVAPADTGILYGRCGLDFTPFVVEKYHVDTINGAFMNMGHDGDSVTLKGPITFVYWYKHAPQEMFAGMEGIETTYPETVVIPAGETWTFTHVDGHDEHPGDWNAYFWLISMDE